MSVQMMDHIASNMYAYGIPQTYITQAYNIYVYIKICTYIYIYIYIYYIYTVLKL